MQLSILFLRFIGDALDYLKVSFAVYFQFSFWDSTWYDPRRLGVRMNWLSILFLRFPHPAQPQG